MEPATEYVALYLPKTLRQEPSMRGFFTEIEAEKYIFTQLCGSCLDDRSAGIYPTSCDCEWQVIPIDDELLHLPAYEAKEAK